MGESVVLIAFFACGFTALVSAIRRIGNWSKSTQGVFLFLNAAFGGLPVLLGKLGVLEANIFNLLLALAFLLTFPVVGTIRLDRAINATRGRAP